jgi:hypothetical protein
VDWHRSGKIALLSDTALEGKTPFGVLDALAVDNESADDFAYQVPHRNCIVNLYRILLFFSFLILFYWFDFTFSISGRCSSRPVLYEDQVPCLQQACDRWFGTPPVEARRAARHVRRDTQPTQPEDR